MFYWILASVVLIFLYVAIDFMLTMIQSKRIGNRVREECVEMFKLQQTISKKITENIEEKDHDT